MPRAAAVMPKIYSTILKIDKNGKCTALKQGSVEIICTIGENTSKFNVNVTSKEDIKIEGTDTLVVGDQYNIKKVGKNVS